MAGSHPGGLPGNHRGRSETGGEKNRHALRRCALAECLTAYLLVPAHRGLLPRHEESSGAKTERLLPRLHCQSLRRNGGRHRCGGIRAGPAFHGGPSGDQDHHPVLRQAHHRRHGKALDRHLYAAEPHQPGDLLSGGFPGAKSLGGHRRRRPAGDRQAGMLCL